MMKSFLGVVTLGLVFTPLLRAELMLPAIFGDHMVLQQKQADPVWGWDTPGTRITVTFAGNSYSTTAGDDGKWTVKLEPLTTNDQPETLVIQGTTTREIRDVLIGEVWLCSGQSNMAFRLRNDWNGDLDSAASTLPELRLIKVPNLGTQEMQTNFVGAWECSTPKAAADFSAVGFFCGRYLQQILHVPVGLIDNSWGGSAAEAWVRRSSLEKDSRFKSLMDSTAKHEADIQSGQAGQDYQQALAKWNTDVAKARAEKETPPRAPTSPDEWLAGQYRPGNAFAGVLYPILGYGIKGVLWYQGESNLVRPREYGSLFSFLIQQWRKEWGHGDFPFYWVQLPNFGAYKPASSGSTWAELRDGQTETMQLTNTGQAIIIDLGEGNNIHPRDKHDVAARLVRWPLARDYGMKLPYRSPEFMEVTFTGNQALVTFDCFGSKLRPFGMDSVTGFALCGKDKVWHRATGSLVGADEVQVTSPDVPAPVAVSYAWANNPVCNLFSDDGLAVTPFRINDSK